MFDPVEFYQFAGRLYQQKPTNEVENRIIVSRAYYSAFLSAKLFSKKSTSSGSIHREVISYFENHTHISIFNQLKHLKDLRQIADYDLDSVVTSNQAGQSLKLARLILIKLNHLT